MKKIILILTLLITNQSFAITKDATDAENPRSVKITTIQTSSKDLFANKLPDNLSEYNYIDPNHIVPTAPLQQTLNFYKNYKQHILNQSYITIVDMTQHSSKKRMYVVNMKTGAVSRYLAAHGKNSDKNDDGYAEAFSNQDGSEMTSLGFYLTDETYIGKHGLSLRLRGLQSTNSNAYDRAIVMHGADYVNPSHTGRSWGCPAIEPKYVNTLVPALKGRSLLYIYKK